MAIDKVLLDVDKIIFEKKDPNMNIRIMRSVYDYYYVETGNKEKGFSLGSLSKSEFVELTKNMIAEVSKEKDMNL